MKSVKKFLARVLSFFLSLFAVNKAHTEIIHLDIKDELEDLYFSQELKPIGRQAVGHVDYSINRIRDNEYHYKNASFAAEVTYSLHVPWKVIAVLHLMEAAGDLSKQILNGEFYDQVTTMVPRGLGPWKSWEASTAEALHLNRSKLPKNWSVGETLNFLEKWNGLGYRRRGMRSPYLWAYSNHQQKGKFISDGVFNENFISLQVGAAVLLDKLNYR